MRWQQGRALVDDMLGRGELERVPASREHADVLLEQAHKHVSSARAIAGSDASGRSTGCVDAGTRRSTRPPASRR